VLSIDNVILSDRDLRRELGAGRIRVEPMDAGAVQPSSIDLRVENQFRIFANNPPPRTSTSVSPWRA
jgi:dCTP deaminase